MRGNRLFECSERKLHLVRFTQANHKVDGWFNAAGALRPGPLAPLLHPTAASQQDRVMVASGGRGRHAQNTHLAAVHPTGRAPHNKTHHPTTKHTTPKHTTPPRVWGPRCFCSRRTLRYMATLALGA